MIFNKMVRIITKPFFEVYSRLFPVSYARFVGVNMGKNIHIYGKVYWGTEPWLITVGDNVYITGGCKFINHDGGTLIFRKEIPDLEITKPIIIGDDVYIGEESFILPGVRIGNNCIIGARSLVSRDVESGTVVAGVPAKVLKSTEEYKQKLIENSLHLGHLTGKKKDRALKKYYGYNG